MAELLRAGILGDVPHGFSDRDGVTAVNRPIAGPMLIARQVHSADVVTVCEPWADDARPAADALVTDRPGLLLAIVTADCAPVLLADREAGVVGAAHAGWRGAVGGVIANTIGAMEALGARREAIAAAVGPCIAQASYEVGADMHAAFPPGAARFFIPGAPDRWQFDLGGYVAGRLRESGVGAVEVLGRDTYAEEDRYESYRRATHRGEPTGGRQLSVIALVQKAPQGVP